MSILKGTDTTLVVGDVHISPNQNLRRATWLGKVIADLKPNRVIFIGDLLTFDSLSGWDKDKRTKMEGRRYQKDIDSGRDFLGKMYSEHYNVWKPEFILTEGNHEQRLHRYLDCDPTFLDTVDYRKDLGLADWCIVPYKEYYTHKGVSFTHIPINEAGKPIGGKFVASKALDIVSNNVVFGHTHKLSSACIHRHGSNHLSQALNVGCYFEHIDEYALGSVTSYWRGLVLIDHYENNSFDWQPIRLGKLKKLYGNKNRKS